MVMGKFTNDSSQQRWKMAKKAWAGVASGRLVVVGTMIALLTSSVQGVAATVDGAAPPPANATPANAAPTSAAPAIKAEWNKVCGTNGVCYVEQYALAMPNKTPVLNVRFDLQGGEGRGRVFFKTPLGVLLREGVQFSIDSHDAITMPYDSCAPTGCVAWAVLGIDTLDTFKKGKTLTVTYFLPPTDAKQPKPTAQPIPVQLTGLSAAMATLGK